MALSKQPKKGDKANSPKGGRLAVPKIELRMNKGKNF